MPDWDPALIDPLINRRDSSSVGWIFPSGRLYSTTLGQLGGSAIPAPGDASAWRQAFGNMSNAGVIRTTENRETFLAKKNAIAYDELHGEGMVVQMYFENNNGLERDCYIPMPDASLFEADGVTLDITNPLVIAAGAAGAALINNTYTPANSFVFTRGVLRDHSGKLPAAAKTRPTIVEPGVVDNPPPDPAV